jgi:ATP-binding cassette, subfamily C, bacterial
MGGTTDRLSGGKEPAAAYLRTLYAFGTRRLVRIGLLMLGGAVLEGFGILLLIPLLGIVFTGGAGLPDWAREVLALTEVGTLEQQLLVMVLLFAALAVVRAIVLWRRDIELISLSIELVDGWRARMVKVLAQARWPAVAALRRSNIEFALTGDVTRLAAGSDQLLRGLSAFVQLGVQLALALWLSPTLAGLAAVLLLATVPFLLPLIRAAHEHGNDLTASGGKRHGRFSDFLAGMKLAKAHNMEQHYADDYIAEGSALRERSLAYASVQMVRAQVFQIAALIVAGGLALIGFTVLHTSPAVLSAMLLLLARLSGPALQLMQGAQSLAAMLPAVANLLAIERDLSAVGSAPTPAASTISQSVAKPQVPAAIALRQVSFSHGAIDGEVLHNIDLAIAPGEFVAMVGASGGGKTTLADIITGLQLPSSGTLLVDGQPIENEVARRAWRAQTAYLPQDPFLFDQSLEQNLRWGAPEADMAAVWQALEAAEADAFVRALPHGLDTRVGDRGSRLSGGERQRVCLARGLLRRPRLMILDEATNALDRLTELRLLETLRRLEGRLTILMITHRPPPDAVVDRLVRLEDGRLHPQFHDG